MQEGDGGNQFTYTPTNPVVTQEVQSSVPMTKSKASPSSDKVIQWQASEFVDHEKDNNWFVLLGLGAIVVCVIVYFVSKSIFSTAVVLIGVIAFGITAKQKPRTMQYSLMPNELRVGEKSYRYDDFRSFSLMQDGALWSIILQPTKRFMPSLTIYIDQSDGEKIFDILATQMPNQERSLDTVDKFMKRIRF
jgi:hypothetical protein